ncbi:DUF1203 domain-containing protein [Sphingomonas sp. RHCKR7]|uniref:DUF1203 domain-containing protein n=1 Tax=Sphingomonas folli TaxID=2862497 RepID=UPI001C66E75A|nr:DUF1203 domain-containing protein [Sphingomonas folli]MBW6528781.1 DUF1203 domain-containing protein [Sphingomonas folli]
MSYRVRGLDPAPFAHLVGRSDAELAAAGVRRLVVDRAPGFPDRVTVSDLPPGETVLLLNYEHQPAPTPYRARHAIFVGERPRAALDLVGSLPAALLARPISLRGYDAAGEMVDAVLAEGAALHGAVERLLGDDALAYVHAHYAARGCYAALIERA